MGAGRLAIWLLAAAVAGCGGDDSGSVTAPPVTPAGTGTTAAPTTATATGPQDCGQVVFTPNSDNGAFAVQATGVSCETARAVAAAAENRSGSYAAEGFDCKGIADETAALASTAWTCTNDGARITFATS